MSDSLTKNLANLSDESIAKVCDEIDFFLSSELKLNKEKMLKTKFAVEEILLNLRTHFGRE